MKSSRLLSLATICLSLFVTPVTQAQPVGPVAESVECSVANSILVVVGKIVEVHALEEDGKVIVQATMAVEETLKGGHGDLRRVQLSRPAEQLLMWKERATRLLVFQSDPPREKDVIDLSDKELAVLTADLSLLRKPEEVLKAAREAVRRMPGVTRIATYDLHVPDQTLVAGTKWEEISKAREGITLAVPIDERLEKVAIEYVRSKDPGIRQAGAILLRHFKSDENVARAKALLEDGELGPPEVDNHVEFRRYWIRETVYNTFGYWGVKVEKPVLRVEIQKIN